MIYSIWTDNQRHDFDMNESSMCSHLRFIDIKIVPCVISPNRRNHIDYFSMSDNIYKPNLISPTCDPIVSKVGVEAIQPEKVVILRYRIQHNILD